MERQTAPTSSSRALALRPRRSRQAVAADHRGNPDGSAPRQPAACQPVSGLRSRCGSTASAPAGGGRGSRTPVTPAMEGSPVPRTIARRASVRSVAGRRHKTHRSLECVRGESGAVQHGRVLRKECAHRVDGVDPRPRRCLQPGEPYDRLQGATDLHSVCGVSRRSREKRHGRNESRIGISGSTARTEAAAVEKAKA